MCVCLSRERDNGASRRGDGEVERGKRRKGRTWLPPNEELVDKGFYEGLARGGFFLSLSLSLFPGFRAGGARVGGWGWGWGPTVAGESQTEREMVDDEGRERERERDGWQ